MPYLRSLSPLHLRLPVLLIVLAEQILCANAQFVRRRRRSSAGVIAGAVIAVVGAVALFLLLMMMLRRRRTARQMAPLGGGASIPWAPFGRRRQQEATISPSMMHEQTTGYPNQQYPGQSYSGQPYGGQPYSGQAYAGQPTNQAPQLPQTFGGSGGGGFGASETRPEATRKNTLPNYEESVGGSPMPQHAPPPGPPPAAHTTGRPDDQFIGGFNPRNYQA